MMRIRIALSDDIVRECHYSANCPADYNWDAACSSLKEDLSLTEKIIAVTGYPGVGYKL